MKPEVVAQSLALVQSWNTLNICFDQRMVIMLKFKNLVNFLAFYGGLAKMAYPAKKVFVRVRQILKKIVT